MSNAFALAAVSAVLRARVRRRLTADDVAGVIGTVDVSIGPPDRIKLDGPEPNALNLFLHRVTRNTGYTAVGQPSRDSRGNLVANPPLALDLHYMVSAYGATPFAADILLGQVMALLHEEPFFTADMIRDALEPSTPDPTLPAVLADAGLATAVQQLRISPATPTTEDVTRLWSALHAAYRPSSFFEVCAVLVESERSARRALPVRAAGTRADPLDRPVIDWVRADGPESTPVTAASTLVIKGRRFRGAGITVVLGEGSARPPTVSDTELRIAVAAFASTLRAGLLPLMVVRDVDLGDPPAPHAAVASDAVPVVVRPTISVDAVTVTGTGTSDGVPWATGDITVTVDPAVTARQRLTLFLNEVGVPTDRAPRAFSLAPPPDNGVQSGDDDTGTVTFDFTRIPRGPYLVRLQVDGVDSLLTSDSSGVFDGPEAVL